MIMVFSLQNLSDSTSGNRNVQNDLRNVKEYVLLHYASLFRNLKASIWELLHIEILNGFNQVFVVSVLVEIS